MRVSEQWSRQAIQTLTDILEQQGYEMEIEPEPAYYPPFLFIFATRAESRIPICATTSYYLGSGIDELPRFVDSLLAGKEGENQ